MKEEVIDEHRTVGDEAIIADRYEVADEGVRLYAAAFSDRRAFLDFDEWTDEAVISNRAGVEIDRLYHGNVFAKPNIDNPDMA